MHKNGLHKREKQAPQLCGTMRVESKLSFTIKFGPIVPIKGSRLAASMSP
jgi:hypothetical protein